jgi:hypothetical protein
LREPSVMTVEPIRAALSGSDRCAAEGLTATAAAPMLALCRMLVTAGHDPARPLHAYRGDVLCLRVSSIGWGARRTVRDNSCGTPTLARWYDRAAGMFAAPPVAQTARPLGGPYLVLAVEPPLLGCFSRRARAVGRAKRRRNPGMTKAIAFSKVYCDSELILLLERRQHRPRI